MPDHQTALSVCAPMLEASGQALLKKRFDLFLPLFALPQVIETFEGSQELHCEADLRSVFDNVCGYYESIGLTDLVRRVVSAEFKSETVISAVHETRLICHGSIPKGAPYPVYSEIRCFDGVWKVAGSMYAIDQAPVLNHALINTRPTADARA